MEHRGSEKGADSFASRFIHSYRLEVHRGES